MKENRYDDRDFFDEYGRMARSVGGLDAAGEWHELRKLLPDFSDKAVLDLGCGYGWHCRYAAQQGARSVIGIDLSERMLEEARARTRDDRIRYERKAIEDIDYGDGTFDVILSSLAFHYVADFDPVCEKISRMLKEDGDFVFSVEHPIFTAQGNQDWCYDAKGQKAHWPVDRYFLEGRRDAVFLGKKVIKYHRTLATYIDSLIGHGFCIQRVVEPMPPQEMLDSDEAMREELRRPMMLLLRAGKGDTLPTPSL